MTLYEQVRLFVEKMLREKKTVDSETIRLHIDSVLSMFRGLGNQEVIDKDQLVREIESRNNIFIGNSTALDNPKDHIPWLSENRGTIQWKFWNRYRRYLDEEKLWPANIIDRLDETTDDVLSRLENPRREGAWDCRGMVVGQVQSGKTANYTGLICKAVDAGYRLFIVLTGMHNNLRSQTQLRLDTEFLGFNTQQSRSFNQENHRIGVGLLDFLIVHSLTSSADKGDFNRIVAKQSGIVPGSDPVLLVVKKNKSVLDNLVKWAVGIRGQKDILTGKKIVRGIPLLVIDDEADNASINTKPLPFNESGNIGVEYDVTAINGLIRELLESFEQSAYVGYTATPFANIFIYPEAENKKVGEDLFPRSFIINLPAPSNYIGPRKLFGLVADQDLDIEAEQGLPIIKIIDDFESFIPDGHKKGFIPKQLPDSLKKAIKAFILSSVIRSIRGQDKQHNTMLVHVTRFQDVQEKVAKLIQKEIILLRRILEYGNSESTAPLLNKFKSLLQEYSQVTVQVKEKIDDPLLQNVSWDEVEDRLFKIVAKIETRTINGYAKDVLDYFSTPSGLVVIAVGGDKLSRGLTLEGLTVSYYLRASRMYDTLMQMGRWFGYRTGYIDLCRLYTTDELVEWFKHITVASEELRKEFDYMVVTGSTPADYGLRVRTHPEGLLITAVNKMRTGTEMVLSYAGQISETTIFHTDKEIIKNNFNIMDAFIKDFNNKPEITKRGQNYIWKDIPAKNIIDLLIRFQIHPECKKANSLILVQYIEAQLINDELTSWFVALINKTEESTQFSELGGYKFGLTQRSLPSKKAEPTDKYYLRNSRLIDPKDEYLDLTDEQIKNVKLSMKLQSDSSSKLSGPHIRSQRPKENGLLLIYPLNLIRESDGFIYNETPVIGLALSFPTNLNARTIKYRVNNIYWEQEFGEQE